MSTNSSQQASTGTKSLADKKGKLTPEDCVGFTAAQIRDAYNAF